MKYIPSWVVSEEGEKAENIILRATALCYKRTSAKRFHLEWLGIHPRLKNLCFEVVPHLILLACTNLCQNVYLNVAFTMWLHVVRFAPACICMAVLLSLIQK